MDYHLIHSYSWLLRTACLEQGSMPGKPIGGVVVDRLG